MFYMQYFYNTKTRARLAKTTGAFLAAEAKKNRPWLESEGCVAIQIRRGDKVRNTSMADLDTYCTQWFESGKATLCNGGSCRDMGCPWPRETRWYPNIISFIFPVLTLWQASVDP